MTVRDCGENLEAGGPFAGTWHSLVSILERRVRLHMDPMAIDQNLMLNRECQVPVD